MKHIYTNPISFYNKKRSFCYFYFNNKRIKIYNGKCLNKNIYPNKEKGKKETIDSLNKLRSLLGNELKNMKCQICIPSKKNQFLRNRLPAF